MLDACGRTIDYVRISITDRCNLRCIYCMPQEGVTCLGHGDILTFEEIERVVRALQHLGVRYVRVTGRRTHGAPGLPGFGGPHTSYPGD